MHSGVHHTAVPRRGPLFGKVDVDVLVPGDVIRVIFDISHNLFGVRTEADHPPTSGGST